MFGRQETSSQDTIPAATQEVFDHRGRIKVIQLDINVSKAEKQLLPWIGYGWTVTSTTAVQLLGQTAFLVATLEKRST